MVCHTYDSQRTLFAEVFVFVDSAGCFWCSGWVFALSALLGFEKPVNFLYFVCIVVLRGVGLVLCAVVSRQARQITHLIQELSILKSESKGDLD